MHSKNTLSNENGQSAIEFILTVAFALGITFLFVNQALNLTAGYLAHYVNFKASRAYLVHETGVDSQDTNINQSIEVVNDIFKKSQLKAFGVNGDFQVITRDKGSALFSGTVLEFKMNMSSMPVVGGGEKVIFYSESLLGKEPTRITCQEQICAAITGKPEECRGGSENMDVVLYDNGC